MLAASLSTCPYMVLDQLYKISGVVRLQRLQEGLQLLF